MTTIIDDKEFSIFYQPESRLKILSRRYVTPLSTSSETAGDAVGVDNISPVLMATGVHLSDGEASSL